MLARFYASVTLDQGVNTIYNARVRPTRARDLSTCTSDPNLHGLELNASPIEKTL